MFKSLWIDIILRDRQTTLFKPCVRVQSEPVKKAERRDALHWSKFDESSIASIAMEYD